MGRVMREMIFRSVLLPAPLRPMMPRASPGWTSNETFLSAQNSSEEASDESRRCVRSCLDCRRGSRYQTRLDRIRQIHRVSYLQKILSHCDTVCPGAISRHQTLEFLAATMSRQARSNLSTTRCHVKSRTVFA